MSRLTPESIRASQAELPPIGPVITRLRRQAPTSGLLKKKWRLVRDAANEEGVGSTETRLSSDLPIGCLKHANVPKHHPEGP